MEFVGIIIAIALIVLLIVSWWKIFEKAGEPGWAAIVPIYNAVTMLKIAGKPWGWIFIVFVPYVGGLIFSIIANVGIAKNFGKSGGFAAGLILLGFVFVPILAFDKEAVYLPNENQGADLDAFGTSEANPNLESDEIQPAV